LTSYRTPRFSSKRRCPRTDFNGIFDRILVHNEYGRLKSFPSRNIRQKRKRSYSFDNSNTICAYAFYGFLLSLFLILFIRLLINTRSFDSRPSVYLRDRRKLYCIIGTRCVCRGIASTVGISRSSRFVLTCCPYVEMWLTLSVPADIFTHTLYQKIRLRCDFPAITISANIIKLPVEYRLPRL